MLDHAGSLFACLAVTVFVSTPVTAAWAAPPPESPATAPPPSATTGATTPASPAEAAPALPAEAGPEPSAAVMPPLRVADRAAYEEGRRSPGAAFAMELVVPGLGSLYGDHWQGAAITWGLSVVGLALVWMGRDTGTDVLYTGLFETVFLTGGGFALLIGARVHGLVDAYRSTGFYNYRLARRLGLYGGMILTPMPLQASGQTTLGFGATWQF